MIKLGANTVLFAIVAMWTLSMLLDDSSLFRIIFAGFRISIRDRFVHDRLSVFLFDLGIGRVLDWLRNLACFLSIARCLSRWSSSSLCVHVVFP